MALAFKLRDEIAVIDRMYFADRLASVKEFGDWTGTLHELLNDEAVPAALKLDIAIVGRRSTDASLRQFNLLCVLEIPSLLQTVEMFLAISTARAHARCVLTAHESIAVSTYARDCETAASRKGDNQSGHAWNMLRGLFRRDTYAAALEVAYAWLSLWLSCSYGSQVDCHNFLVSKLIEVTVPDVPPSSPVLVNALPRRNYDTFPGA